ncbi:ribonuclease H family protein [Bosea rubneri]|uniref:ribonuclease H n=1 Tax=Bosea rubneri TaxID=3075434 RepID=A0ABU3SDW4_9HYPH|nr:ribonuclease H [Bosea sp. ZW T0_25]MDU0342980.1 ribonuclease H [Bosea sp. ZW T0_25]
MTSPIDRIAFNPAARPIDTVGIDTSFQRMTEAMGRPFFEYLQHAADRAVTSDERPTMESNTTDLMDTTPSSPRVEWRVWSDGASLGNPGPAGWAVLALRPDGTGVEQYGSADHRTNNEAELHALLKAVKAVPLDCPAVVYSDSEYSINAATTDRPRWEANGMKTSKRKPVKNQGRIRKLWAALDERPQVRLMWTKGHAGEEGNERVDTLANEAAEAVKAGKKPVHKRTHELAA